ncbi:MAG TPA: toprim domain-containing protein, partial [Vicinamibacterales bacterium]|nr:toprim domain-containing protein [Vicinamibacterales bacterium]
HGDKGPSCSLTRGADGTLRVRCFGCGFAGDVFHLVAACRSLTLPRDFVEVLREAAALASIAMPDLPAEREVPMAIGDELFAAIVARMLGLAPLRRARDVSAYLERRRIGQQAARDGWGALPAGGAQDAIVRELAAEFGAEALIGSGLCLRDERTERLRLVRPGARVLIPWRAEDGRIVSLQRRRIDDGEPRYVASAGRPLRTPYGLDRLTPSGPVAFVEGAVDVLALRELCARRRFACNVLGLPGVEGWRPAWAQLAAGRRAYLALDDDEAGDAKAVDMARDLEAAGARPKRWRPSAKDWSEVLTSQKERT